MSVAEGYSMWKVLHKAQEFLQLLVVIRRAGARAARHGSCEVISNSALRLAHHDPIKAVFDRALPSSPILVALCPPLLSESPCLPQAGLVSSRLHAPQALKAVAVAVFQPLSRLSATTRPSPYLKPASPAIAVFKSPQASPTQPFHTVVRSRLAIPGRSPSPPLARLHPLRASLCQSQAVLTFAALDNLAKLSVHCTYDTPGAAELASADLAFTVPFTFGRIAPALPVARHSAGALPLDAPARRRVPAPAPLLPFGANLPVYSQLFDSQGNRKMDATPLPLYTCARHRTPPRPSSFRTTSSTP
ncbi:hypothetical protein FB451DRAFT_1557184 [Mycena latifolia]|nr:hypothetical protein FB451DRAFT_1557184 [Mycena latifolia]